MALTPESSLDSVPGFGLVTLDQPEPSQWMINVSLPQSAFPTAHTSVDDTTLAPSSSLKSEPRFGLGTHDQRVPSQWRIEVSSPCLPTAQAFLPETALPL
jgi:hypothetical protein